MIWLRRISYFLVLVSLALILASGILNRLGIVGFRTALGIFSDALTLTLPAMALCLITIVMGLYKKQSVKLAVAGLFVAAALYGAGAAFKTKGKSVPPIHDITTDTENPPQFKEILKLRVDAPNSSIYVGGEVAELQKKAYPEVTGKFIDSSKKQVFADALELAKNFGWEIVDQNPEEGQIEAVATTFFFGFKDDVVIRISELEAKKSKVDMRSVSRVGKSDLGANAKRINAFLTKLN